MKKLLYISLFVLLATACKKEPDSPPANVITDSVVVTIDSLRSMQEAVAPGGVHITDSLHVYAIVTMDESAGNIYKNLYVQDHTAGINVRLLESSDFAVGDSVRISLIGAYLSEYSGVIQLDSIDPDTDIVRQSAGNDISPAVKNLDEITVDDEGLLIQLNNVQFTGSELSSTYANAFTQESEDRILEDCSGNMVIVRTSGFANFANDTVAQQSGSLVCIASRFGSTIQLIIRSPEEIDMDNQRCAGQILVKDFEDGSITSGGWTNVIVSGSTTWIAEEFSSNYYGKVTNWNGSSNDACESWFISPEIDLTASTSASMSFLNDVNYNPGDPLAVLISTEYAGVGNPSQVGNWVDLSSLVSWDPVTNDWGLHPSGNIDLTAYVGNTVYIAFKYTGSASEGNTWEIDDIIING
jgi:hypothetical protein